MQLKEANNLKENLSNISIRDGDEFSIYCDETVAINNSLPIKKTFFSENSEKLNEFKHKSNLVKTRTEDFSIYYDEKSFF